MGKVGGSLSPLLTWSMRYMHKANSSWSIFPSLSISASVQIAFSVSRCSPLCSITFMTCPPHVLCVDTGRSSETAKAHRG
eukprot:TRINITY_DN9572_c0_g1_i1.p2 TRINITY_DN9572_c0_g1~~TRINITY_DN9572_c0_g1_i1.p2  ORF type:complete len:80 (-),score=8.36 TRINITY_DN9572_c0_g1_i1:2-241(-)